MLAANLLPRANTIHIDGRVLAFTAGVSALVGVLCGLWPVVRLRVRALTSAIREADTRTASGRSTFGNGIVVAEIALAFALLVGAGLLLKNLMLLEQRDAGIQTSRIVAFDVAVAGNRYKADEQQSAFFREAVESPSGRWRRRSCRRDEPPADVSLRLERRDEHRGGNPWGPRDAPLVENRWIAGDYFKTMGIPLVQGRLFDERDRKGNTQVVVINRAMAEKFWPGRDPIGRRLAPGSTHRLVAGRRRRRQRALVRPGLDGSVRNVPDDRPAAVRRDDHRGAHDGAAIRTPSSGARDRSSDRSTRCSR